MESQRLERCGATGVSYRGTRSGTADLQPILGILRSAISEDVFLQKCTTPCLGAKQGKKRENEVIDEGVTAVKELQQTLVP